jgi:DtxR family Mn-dependent transcriptional regulator
MDDLGLPATAADDPSGLVTLTAAADGPDTLVTVNRISEQLQPDAAVMHRLVLADIRPGRRLHVGPNGHGTTAAAAGIEVWTDGERTVIDAEVSDHVFVRVG